MVLLHDKLKYRIPECYFRIVTVKRLKVFSKNPAMPNILRKCSIIKVNDRKPPVFDERAAIFIALRPSVKLLSLRVVNVTRRRLVLSMPVCDRALNAKAHEAARSE